MKFKGYQPTEKTLDRSDPPKHGSGVPKRELTCATRDEPKMYFNMFTGEISDKDGDNMLSLTTNWFPYHNLEKKYVGFRRMDHFAKPNGNEIEYVNTYEEMNW